MRNLRRLRLISTDSPELKALENIMIYSPCLEAFEMMVGIPPFDVFSKRERYLEWCQELSEKEPINRKSRMFSCN